jgi:hypothetical protein
VTRPRLAIAAVLALAGTAAVPAYGAPRVGQLVVFRDGDAKQDRVGTKATRVRVGDRRCRVPRATPLAALVRSEVAPLRLRDFSGSCDPSSLFVSKIGSDRNRGQSGWVYKVGNRQGTTAASDPSGPFGNGHRLETGARVTWFYCVFGSGGCQRTLGLRARDQGGGVVSARVTAYDDEGRGERLEGATVHSGASSAQTDANGVATLTLSAGRHRLYAEESSNVRSFTERVRVE